MIGNNYLLWEDDDFIVKTPFNPHIQYSEGLHIVVAPKLDVGAAWDDPKLAGRAFELASKVAQVAEQLKLAPWFNIQANGNWGLLPNSTPFFHIHVYGRNKTDSWGKPIVLPVGPNTYKNNPMPEQDRNKLSASLTKVLK